MSFAVPIRRFALDAVLWSCAPAFFLTLYIQHFSFPAESVLPHLRLIFLPLLFVALIRVVLARAILQPMWSRLIAAVLTAFLLLTVLIYYGLVIVGLDSWGQVISWELITSYASQAANLADALGVSIVLAIGILCAALAAASAALYAYFKSFDWPSAFVATTPDWLIVVLVASTAIVIAFEVVALSLHRTDNHSEPIHLTFFPQQANRAVASLEIEKANVARLDLMEDTARTTYEINPSADRKNLVLIVVDALRPSNMGIYGYQRDTTPYLDRVLQNGQMRVISEVRATCGESACGLFSLVTSKYAHQVSERPFSLYQVLKRHGYAIHMILGGDHTNFYGLKQLYREADSYFDGANAKGYYMNDDQFVLDRVAGLPSWNGKPLMLQFHLMSAHTLGRRKNEALRFSPTANYVLPQNRGPDDHDKIINHYDNGVVQTDSVIRNLLASLEEKGYLTDALVVITADHGEALGEHGLYAHANSVREKILGIPLAFVAYGYQPTAIPSGTPAVSQVDIAPTILAEFAMTRPTTWTGTPLQELKHRDFTYFHEQSEVGLIDDRDPQNRWKYWMDLTTHQQYAFNLGRDPEENFNAIIAAPGTLRQEWAEQLRKLRPVTAQGQSDNTSDR